MGRRPQPIADFLLDHVAGHPRDLVSVAAARFSISRQAVHQHLRRLIGRGLISASGRTQSRRYGIQVLAEVEEDLSPSRGTDEAATWRSRFLPELSGIPANVLEIARFGFTEVVRNALEHSEADEVSARLRRTGAALEIRVADPGLGIFHRLERDLGFAGARRAALEIAKGEMTTDRDRPSGRGLSIVASSFDAFLVASGTHLLRREVRGANTSWRLETISARVRGTSVGMRIGVRSNRTLATAVAGGLAPGGSAARARTVIPVHLALEESEQPTSRNQARRISERIERFGELVFDFEGIASVGPAFADELLRVVGGRHPGVRIRWKNAVPEVERMLRRAADDGGVRKRSFEDQAAASPPDPGVVTPGKRVY